MKIPFGTAVSGAYRWTFRNFLSVLGIGWFPYLLIILFIAALIYAIAPQFESFIALAEETGKPDRAKFVSLLMTILLTEAVAIPVIFLLTAMATVGMVRQALGLHPGPTYIFFSLGSQVWRLFGAYLLLILLAWGSAIVFGAVVALVAVLLRPISEGGAMFLVVVLCIAGVLFWIYALVRTYFFLPAIVVAENHMSLRRSWHLGYQNFWRIIGIFFAVTIPAGIALQVLTQAVFQIMYGGQPLVLGPQPTPAEMRAFFAHFLDMLKQAAPFIAVVELLYMTALSGLIGAATANAYRLVTGDEDIGPPAPAKAAA